MKKYKVLCNCVGFKRRYWTAGTIVDLEDNENPPKHFQLIESDFVEVNNPEPQCFPLSQLGKIPKVVGGFGSSLPEEGEVTRVRKQKTKA